MRNWDSHVHGYAIGRNRKFNIFPTGTIVIVLVGYLLLAENMAFVRIPTTWCSVAIEVKCCKCFRYRNLWSSDSAKVPELSLHH